MICNNQGFYVSIGLETTAGHPLGFELEKGSLFCPLEHIIDKGTITVKRLKAVSNLRACISMRCRRCNQGSL